MLVMGINKKVEDYREKHQGLLGVVGKMKGKLLQMEKEREMDKTREKGDDKAKDNDRLMGEILQWKEKESQWKVREDALGTELSELKKEIEKGKMDVERLIKEK